MKINNVEVNTEEVEVTERSIVAEDLIADLHSGLTWLKKDDLGYGSIEEKYSANPYQIKVIRKLPVLQGVKTKVTIFKVEEKDQNKTKPVEVEKVKVEETNNAAELFANL
jgi:hypothetical protein